MIETDTYTLYVLSMLETPIIIQITPNYSYRQLRLLASTLTALWLIGFLLFFPPVSRAKDHTSEIHSENSLNKIHTVTDETDILKVYKSLFRQTWELSPSIQVARKLQEQKSAEKYTAWAKRLSPQLDFELSQKEYINKDSSPDNVQKRPPETVKEDEEYTDGRSVTEWEFNLNIPIYRQALTLSLDISRLEHNLAVNNLEIKTGELDSKLHELLSRYMVSCYNLHNLNNSIHNSSEHVDKIKRGYDLRDQTKLALLRAQANLKELEARKDLNEQKRDTAFRELLDYTAIPEQNPTWCRLQEILSTEEKTAACINSFSALDASANTLKSFISPSGTDSKLRDFFVNNSLLYKKILIERDIGKTKAKKYTQQEWPELFLRGGLNRRNDTRFSDYSGEGSIGLVLSVPLFSGGTMFSNIKTKNRASDIASIQEYSDILKTLNSIANKKKTITSLQNIFQKQKTNLQQQQEIVRLSLKSYQIKQTSMQDLLTSKNRLIDAKNLLMQTTSDLGILLRQFAWELGTPFPSPSIAIENP